MSMIIRNNVAAINANRNLNASQNSLTSSLEKLSSGYRINKGADGPADLVISEQLRAQISGLERAVRNTNEAINVLSIAEGALNEMNNILKSMKALAIHASSNGVTSGEQIEADQAEMDSYIQTLQRIADTTKYSDEMLLNGNKDLTYSVSTEIKGTQNNQLVDHGTTDFLQIYKRDGYTVSFGFTGAVNASSIDNIGDADMSKQAMKAYMEIDPVADTLSQIDEDGYLTQSQSFILTGALGSRQFNFGAGTSITQIVTSIQSYADSTGIDASLIFNSNQTINQSINVANATSIAGACGTTSARTWGDATIFDNYFIDGDDNRQTLITGIDTDTLTGVQYGFNTDGNGNIYVKYIGNGQYELYKDSSFSEATLIGVSDSTGNVVERNNSGIGGLKLTFHDDAQYGDTAYISLGNIALDGNNVHASGVMNGDASNGNGFSLEGSIASGVQLGINTDANGKIFIKVVTDEDGMSVVYAYNDESMSSSSLVAQSDKVYLVAGEAVILDQIWNSDGTASTGLGLHLNITDDMTDPDGYYDGWIQFTNLGARISSSEYGSDAFIQVQQSEGGLFTYYDQPDSYKSATLVDAAGTGVTVRITGQDATINVNGQQMKTNGLKLDMATTDIMAKVVFNSGKSGSTTIAQVGYNEGTIFTKATALTFSKREAIDDGSANQFFSALLNNACHNTKEAISKFQGGMQLQLGETAGDQSRTVVSLKSMAVSNLGQIKVTRAFDSSSAVIETRTLSLSDVLGGQIASLTEDPVLAMRIIEQAIDDVSVMRAQIGALQANLLQTNANNLEVAIENITNTESAIRDTDMATEMTNYTAAQVLQNAGISMLAQANSQAQSVLSLLQ